MHKGTLRDTGQHAQVLPAARHRHKAGLCSELFVYPSALAQAPGSRMAIAPFSQVPAQPNFTPRSEARPAELVATCLGHQRGVAGGSQAPVVAERRTAPAAMQACLARLLVSSSPSHPPSAGPRLLTSVVGQYTCPTDVSTKYTYHLPDDKGICSNLPLFHLYNNFKT